jgi:hypothetical protein
MRSSTARKTKKRQKRVIEMKVFITFDTTSENEQHIAKRSIEIKRKLRCSEHIMQEYIGNLANVDYGSIQFDLTSGNKPYKDLTV